jgi:two-component system LytT family response regulator
MLKAIIADNEEPAVDVLKILLERTGRVNVTGSYLSAADALSGLQASKPDVAFLDIEMPEINGLELAEKILEIDGGVEIIFVTAYDQYALKAFRVNALDYLLKPLSPEDVEQTVSRLIKRKGSLSSPHNKLLSNGRVYCFGKLSVYGAASEQPVKWRTSKAEELFAYMLQNLETEVPKWKICEALWPEYNAEKIDIQLHTTIYKMKKVLTAANIKFDFKFINSCYWMNLYGIYIDIAEFDSMVEANNVITEDIAEKYEKALSLYKSNYLEENDYIWSLPKREEYSKKFYKSATCLVNYYIKRNDYAAAERILRSILGKFPLDESAHRMLLKLYFVRKDRAAFVTHYNAVKKLFKAELGIEPSNSMQALYKSMLFSRN